MNLSASFYAKLKTLPSSVPCEGWAPLMTVLDKLEVPWTCLPFSALADLLVGEGRRWHEVAPGSPFLAVHAEGRLYFSDTCGTSEIAHEVGHAAVWVRDGRPAGTNWGLGETGGEAELDATAVQAYFMYREHGQDLYSIAVQLYTAGIGVCYDPDDAEEEWYAVQEAEGLVEQGGLLLQQVGVL